MGQISHTRRSHLWPCFGLGLLAWAIACQPTAPVERANALYDSGDPERGIAILEEAVEEDPSNARLQFEYGKLLMRHKRTSLATWPLFRAAQSPEYREKATMLVARSLMEAQNNENASRMLDALLEENPELEPALLLRAQARVKGHQEELALEDLNQLMELRPQDFAILQARLEALLRLSRTEDAQAQLEQMKELSRTAEDVPPDLPARLCTIDAIFTKERGEKEEARVLFQGCLADYPKNMLLISEAMKFHDELEEYSKGTKVLEDAATLDGGTVESRLALSRRYREFGQNEVAEKLLRDSAEEMDSPLLWAELSRLYVGADRLEEARAAIERAFSVNGPAPTGFSEDEEARSPFLELETIKEEGLFRMGDILVLLHEEEKVQEIIELLEEPAHKHFLAGRMKLELGDDQGGLEEYEKGFRYWPANAGARYLAARAAARQGLFPEAVVHYKESVRADAAATPAGLELARLQMAQGQAMAASESMRHYIGGNPKDATALRLWAQYSARAGRAELVEIARQSLSRLPGHNVTAIVDHAWDVAMYSGPEEAIAYLLEMAPNVEAAGNREILSTLVQLEIKQGMIDQVMARINSLRSHQEVPDAALERIHGEVLLQLGRKEEAAEAFSRARSLDDKEWRALIASARLATASSELEQAVAWYDRAAQYSPDPQLPRYEAALRLLTDEAAPAQRLEGESRMRELLHEYPHHGQAAHQLARLAHKRGESNEAALALAQRAAQFHGTPAVVETLGQLHLARGEYQSAVEALRRSNPSTGGTAAGQAALGRALLELGDTQGARAAFERALASGGLENEAEVRAQLARLRGSAEPS